MTFDQWKETDEAKALRDTACLAENPDEAYARFAWLIAERAGFERGAQWALMDQAFRSGNFAIVGSKGVVANDERNAAVNEMLRDLFVPKPGLT